MIGWIVCIYVYILFNRNYATVEENNGEKSRSLEQDATELAGERTWIQWSHELWLWLGTGIRSTKR